MIRLSSAALALCLPLSALAEADVAADFEAMHRLYYPNGETDLRAAMLNGLRLIERIDGDWIAAHHLFVDGNYNAERAAEACERLPSRIASVSPFAFTVTRAPGGSASTHVISYSFIGGLTFARTVDLQGYLEFAFPGRDMADMPPGQIIGAIGGATRVVTVNVHMSGEDVLVFDQSGVPAEILTRCPD